MADKSKIEWTDATWNPIRGCSVVSEGCRNCYAMQVAARFSGDDPKTGKPLAYKDLAYRNESGAHWTGQVEFIGEHLEDPLKWKEPRRIFVNSMSDLFHENVEDQWITDIFGIMALAHWHTFQILTKRPERMRDYLAQGDHGIINQFRQIQQCGGIGPRRMFRALDLKQRDNVAWHWPLPNVWLGVSVEDQKTAHERLGLLLDTPAAIRWASVEPLLNAIDLEEWIYKGNGCYGAPARTDCAACEPATRVLDWVVVGGESGAGARPMHPDWARLVRDQCVAASVPFFFKQWGEYVTIEHAALQNHIKPGMYEMSAVDVMNANTIGGGFIRVGKKRGGRMLDGREWNEMPASAR